MTLQIQLPEEQVRALAEQAKSHGVSPEDYASQLLQRELAGGSGAEPFWKAFGPVHALPDEALDGLPADGASEHDHYLYRAPKRDSWHGSSRMRSTGSHSLTREIQPTGQ